MKQIVIKPEQCIGCRSCELICSVHRSGAVSPRQSAVTVYEADETVCPVPLMCMHCDEPVCADHCPVEALKRDPSTGAIQWHAARCIHCGRCVVSCPLGNIRLSPSRESLIKCDLCGGAPSCAAVCPVAAIDFLEVNDEMDEQTMVFDQGRGGH